MTDSYFDLYYQAHCILIDASSTYILSIFKGDVLSPPTNLVKMVIEEQTKIVNEQTVMVQMLYDVVNGRKFDMPHDAEFFINLINDSLRLNSSLMDEVNAKRRETLLEIRRQLHERREAQILEQRHANHQHRFRLRRNAR